MKSSFVRNLKFKNKLYNAFDDEANEKHNFESFYVKTIRLLIVDKRKEKEKPINEDEEFKKKLLLVGSNLGIMIDFETGSDNLICVTFKNRGIYIFRGFYKHLLTECVERLNFELEDTFDSMNPPVVPEEKDNLFVVANKERLYGANALLLPEVIKEYEELSDRDVIYIIPSSIHEIILVPADEDFTQEELLEMIQNVNDTDLNKTNVLSYSLYKWERNSNEITVV